MDGSVVYELCVRGALDASWIHTMEFDKLSIIDSDEHGVITVMTGTFQDQAELRGLLDRLYGLNLPLISVHQIADPE